MVRMHLAITNSDGIVTVTGESQITWPANQGSVRRRARAAADCGGRRRDDVPRHCRHAEPRAYGGANEVMKEIIARAMDKR
ncbi:hypothetical protein [Aquabacterium sp.]|uniref:hypothetical protein n=1 Tax=Aquabacterium sp. TaxID=1872578 RepID=UPI002C027E97|nr:hypothetical protein [Aquabacterium sp.]HSW04190.1 hypothetical protein [Aquabacterium sp.]